MSYKNDALSVFFRAKVLGDMVLPTGLATFFVGVSVDACHGERVYFKRGSLSKSLEELNCGYCFK